MIARIVTFMLIAVLGLPVTTLSRPGATHKILWIDSTMAAKVKNHKKKGKKRR